MLNEPDDGADTVAWLLDQPWCDGSIGTFGPSYLGFVQWASATASDRVRAIAPCVTTTEVPARHPPLNGAARASTPMSRSRVPAGSITSSISNAIAVLSAWPRAY